jgi:3-hydroxyacyl-CoA dehydrogenase
MNKDAMERHIAVIGAGLIGRSWAIVFARAGFSVALYDISSSALAGASDAIAAALDDLVAAGLIENATAITERIHKQPDFTAAVAGAAYVQECGPETVAAKRELFGELDREAQPDTILASSTSGIVASRFVSELTYPERCLVAHPVNPPYLIPLVELVPAPATSEAVVTRAKTLLSQAGQVPITVRREVQGFILNRLQGALLNEALRLVEGDTVSAEDLDKTVKHGLGLRWSFMGPFETIDLNAPGGIADYARRYGPLYTDMVAAQSAPPDWSEAALAKLERERRDVLPEAMLTARGQWRDQRLMALVAHQLHMHNSE